MKKVAKQRHWVSSCNLGIRQAKKANVRFEISPSKIVYRPNFVKINKLLFFGTKCLNFGIWARKFGKQISHLWNRHLRKRIQGKFVKIRKLIPF